MLKGVVLLAVCLASRACSVAGAAVPSVSLDAQQRVHLPGHVTIVPEEVAVTQKQQGLSSTAGSAQQHDASSQGWQGFDQQASHSAVQLAEPALACRVACQRTQRSSMCVIVC